MYFTILAKVEEVNDASYDREVKKDGKLVTETIPSTEISCTVPGMRDRVRVTFDPTLLPKADTLDKWELEEVWVLVKADSMRALGYEGKKGAQALVTFSGTEIREASADERRALQEARKVAKAKSKQRRADAKKAKADEKQAAQPAA